MIADAAFGFFAFALVVAAVETLALVLVDVFLAALLKLVFLIKREIFNVVEVAIVVLFGRTDAAVSMSSMVFFSSRLLKPLQTRGDDDDDAASFLFAKDDMI